MFDARRRAIGFEAAKSFDEITTNFFFQSKKITSTKMKVTYRYKNCKHPTENRLDDVFTILNFHFLPHNSINYAYLVSLPL